MDSSSIPTHNIYHELNSKQTDDKRLIYDYKDILAKMNEINIVNVEDNQEEYDTIKLYVQKGHTILINELKKHKELTVKKNNIEEFENSVKSTCLECQQKLSQLIIKFETEDIDTVDLQNHIDSTVYSLGSIFELASKNAKEKTEILSQEINKNNSIIRYLSNTYNILKNTSLGHTCSICLMNEVTQFCDPCGHCYCSKCMKGNYCYMCRMKVNKLNPLFYP